MVGKLRWRLVVAGLVASSTLLACGGGSGGSATTPTSGTVPAESGAPVSVNNIPVDGLNWINYRRTLAGMPVLTRNTLIDVAAQGHSTYMKTNDVVAHDQVAGKPDFTGVKLLDRLHAAGYFFASSGYAYGEVISAATSNSGFFLAEELITAIYHRFVIFEPQFKEIGTGAAKASSGYAYFTSDFAANNGFGPGLGSGKLVGWPADGQQQVVPNFMSDNESPDPVAGVNEVGYPVSVHADLNTTLTVTTFTMRPRGGTDISVKLLRHSTDADTPASAAAIVPLQVLKAGTTYDVSFSGQVGTTAVTRNWSFTTR